MARTRRIPIAPLVFVLLAFCWFRTTAASLDVTSFAQLRGLDPKIAASAVPFHTEAIALSYDPGWGQLYFHDGGETKWISPTQFTNTFRKGDWVTLTGHTAVTDGTPVLTNARAVIIGHRELPPAKKLLTTDLAREFGQWIEVSGNVRVADTSWGRLGLVIEADGQSCLAYVMGTPPVNYKRLVGATVRVRGINGTKAVNNRIQKAMIMVPDFEEVKLLEEPRTDPTRAPVTSVETLLHRQFGDWTNGIVHLNGTITGYSPGEWIEIKDPTGSMRGQIVQTTRVQPGQRVDLWGFPVLSPNGMDLKDCYFEAMNPFAAEVATPRPTVLAQTNKQPALTTAAQILHLPKKSAASGIPVRLRGVLTYADPEWRVVFFHDDSGDIYVESDKAGLRAGQIVEIAGITSSGGFAPEVVAADIIALGTTNLPAPVHADLGEVAGGTFDARWVELEGVVRRINEEWGHVSLLIMTPKGSFRAIVPSSKDAELPVQLVDALIRIRGACGAQLNTRGQLTGVILHVPSFAQIEVLEAPPADPFAIAATSIAAIATFDPERTAGRRVKVSGTVELVLPDKGFFVQDATGGMRVAAPETAEIHAGDLVEVLGFVGLGGFSPQLDEAAFRRIGTGQPMRVRDTTAAQILVQGTNDAVQVRIEAQLVQDATLAARPKLILQNGSILFTATLESHNGAQFPPWKAGSILRLTGVCVIEGTEAHEPDTFNLLIADVGDVKLVSAPSWWSLQHTLALVSGMTFLIGVALGWVALLRRQVRVQTDLIHKNQKDLADVAHRAGMAEVATSVLHNVGNALTNVNVSSALMEEQIEKSKVRNLAKAADLLKTNCRDLPAYLSNDPKGRQLPAYFDDLAKHLASEREELLVEFRSLRKNVEHIRQIVAMQQNYAKVSGIAEPLRIEDLADDALRMNESALKRHDIKVVRKYEERLPKITTERNKVLQILVNLIQNAKHACVTSKAMDKQIQVTISLRNGYISVCVSDNGVGIATDNLNRVFQHGFTTRQDGHGFGLHSGALAAKELGGSLKASSAGLGCGASFTLELPVHPEN